MTAPKQFAFKDLLPRLPKNAPVDLDWLAQHNVNASYAARLARNGYLQKLGAGTYSLPGITLEQDACLSLLQNQVPHMHLASKSALAWRGVRHNLAVKEKLVLWGETQFKVPTWFSKEFPTRHHTTHIFDKLMKPDFGLSNAPGKPENIRVSVPERAMLELFSEVGTQVGLEEARNLTENTRNLRADVLEHLLSHTNRIKVVRIAEHFARELDLPWLDLAKTHSRRLGGGSRWVLSHPTSLQTISLKKSV